MNKYTYKKQGDSRDSWICEEPNGNKYMVYDSPETLLKKSQYDELQPTDWYFVRKVELGIDVPNDIILERLAIRKKYDDLKTDL
jgi:hypothetical protein